MTVVSTGALGMSSRRRIPGSGSKYDSSEHWSTVMTTLAVVAIKAK